MRLHGTLNVAASRYRANGLPAISAGFTVALASEETTETRDPSEALR